MDSSELMSLSGKPVDAVRRSGVILSGLPFVRFVQFFSVFSFFQPLQQFPFPRLEAPQNLFPRTARAGAAVSRPHRARLDFVRQKSNHRRHFIPVAAAGPAGFFDRHAFRPCRPAPRSRRQLHTNIRKQRARHRLRIGPILPLTTASRRALTFCGAVSGSPDNCAIQSLHLEMEARKLGLIFTYSARTQSVRSRARRSGNWHSPALGC